MTFFGGLVDPLTGKRFYVTPQNELKVAQVMRLMGPDFHGTTLDTNFWTAAVLGTGSVTQVSGEVTLQTGATADSAASITSKQIARFTFGNPNLFCAAIKLPDTGQANNTKRWGCFSAADGVGFVLNGTTFGVFTRVGSSDTTVNSGSFNGGNLDGGTGTWTVDTDVHFFEIVFYVARVDFYIDGALIHTIVPTSGRWADDLCTPIVVSNTNSGGSTTDVAFEVWNAVVQRFSAATTQPTYAHLAANATTVLKYGHGELRRVVVNTAGSAGNTLTLYDNTAGSGTVIAVIALASAASGATLEYDLVFQTGLTAVIATGTPGDVTIIYD